MIYDFILDSLKLFSTPFWSTPFLLILLSFVIIFFFASLGRIVEIILLPRVRSLNQVNVGKNLFHGKLTSLKSITEYLDKECIFYRKTNEKKIPKGKSSTWEEESHTTKITEDIFFVDSLSNLKLNTIHFSESSFDASPITIEDINDSERIKHQFLEKEKIIYLLADYNGEQMNVNEIMVHSPKEQLIAGLYGFLLIIVLSIVPIYFLNGQYSFWQKELTTSINSKNIRNANMIHYSVSVDEYGSLEVSKDVFDTCVVGGSIKKDRNSYQFSCTK